MTTKAKPKPKQTRKPTAHKVTPKRKPLTAQQAALKALYPGEKAAYRSLPADKRGPGKLTGGPTVMLSAATVALTVTAVLDEAGASITGGYGGWEQVLVPRQDPFTQWNGRGLYTMDLAIMLDGWGRQASIEPGCKSIEAMALRDPGMLTPPPIRLYGAVPHPELKWVVTGIDWGDVIRNSRSGQRMRQRLVLHLMEYRDGTTLVALPKASASVKSPRKYKVKAGDDLKKIAARMLGKSSAWPSIVKLNKGLRGWKLTKAWVGKTIKVPAQADSPSTKKTASKATSKHPSTGKG